MNTQRVEKAVERFEERFNCAQAVFSAFSADQGVPTEQALKIGAAFGAGIARRGELCGALSGALMAIGLRYGATDPKDQAAKEKTYAVSQEFLRRFKARHGTVLCADLIGVDLSTPAGLKDATERRLFVKVCPDFVRSSAEILEETLRAEEA